MRKRSKVSETPNKKVRVRPADFSAHHNFVVRGWL
nr:MAG TPA: hypothetical protein [Caudoviricetes sp.]